ncbi:MAG: type I methionyl aminopeptidase [Oscillospiraceae bacterium]|jgi:methionyl aminopeptidase|nr:type I methionyl aminopeptidase [Oscillospiraceae bacterium]
MVFLKSKKELELMRAACEISAEALRLGGEAVRPGVSTWEIDRVIHEFIKSQGAAPNFMENGFPASACVSVNEEVIHGIPSKSKILQPGDIVSIDTGALYKGYNGDNAATFPVGEIAPEHKTLLETTKAALYSGIEAAVAGNRVGDISNAVETSARARGFGVVREFVGHGIGRELHEEPEVPNYGSKGRGRRLAAGMTLAIEPMITLSGDSIVILDDGWTVVAESGKYAAHFEHTIAVTENGPEIYTLAWERS